MRTARREGSHEERWNWEAFHMLRGVMNRIREETYVAIRNELLESKIELSAWSAEVDRRMLTTYSEIRSELRKSSELSRCERAEAK